MNVVETLRSVINVWLIDANLTKAVRIAQTKNEDMKQTFACKAWHEIAQLRSP